MENGKNLHMHLYLNNVETKSQKHEPIVLFRYTDDILFISIHGQEELQQLPKEQNKTHLNLKFTPKSSKEKLLFLDL